MNVKNDGNQQFRALAHQVYGSEEAHNIVRLLVISEILTHPHLYERYIPYRGVDIQEYAQVHFKQFHFYHRMFVLSQLLSLHITTHSLCFVFLFVFVVRLCHVLE